MDRNDLLAAMYDADDKRPANRTQTAANTGRSRKIRVGIVEYEVPSMEYVRHLEELLAQQAQQLAQQRSAIDRLNELLHGTRNFIRRQNHQALVSVVRRPTYDL